MKGTRVDSTALKTSVQQVSVKMGDIRSLLSSLLVTSLTDQERKEVLRAPVRINDAGRDMAVLAKSRPTLTAAAGYDPDAVIEDLENLELLSGLAESFAEVMRWIEDSKLVWAGEAYDQSLRLYNVAKALEKSDGSIRTLVDPLEKVFAARRRNRSDSEDSTPVPAPSASGTGEPST